MARIREPRRCCRSTLTSTAQDGSCSLSTTSSGLDQSRRARGLCLATDARAAIPCARPVAWRRSGPSELSGRSRGSRLNGCTSAPSPGTHPSSRRLGGRSRGEIFASTRYRGESVLRARIDGFCADVDPMEPLHVPATLEDGARPLDGLLQASPGPLPRIGLGVHLRRYRHVGVTQDVLAPDFASSDERAKERLNSRTVSRRSSTMARPRRATARESSCADSRRSDLACRHLALYPSTDSESPTLEKPWPSQARVHPSPPRSR